MSPFAELVLHYLCSHAVGKENARNRHHIADALSIPEDGNLRSGLNEIANELRGAGYRVVGDQTGYWVPKNYIEAAQAATRMKWKGIHTIHTANRIGKFKNEKQGELL
jgi:hypothetical protein